MQEIMQRVNKVFREVFQDPKLEVTDKTCAADIEGWDSFQHINLIGMLENEFGITFEVEQIVAMENVGDIVRAIEEKAK